MKDKGDAKSFDLPCFHLIIGRGARHLVEAVARILVMVVQCHAPVLATPASSQHCVSGVNLVT